MLRFLYSAALRAHPPYFRQRFAEEMLAIFDQAHSRRAQTGLLADAVVSLVRQWTVRPRFWEEPAAVADSRVVLFSSLGEARPRMAALFSGAILSALVLNGVSLTMGYAWEHPRFLEFRQPTIVPPASWRPPSSREAPVAQTYAEPYPSTDQGRVLLIFNAPNPATSRADRREASSVPLGEIVSPKATAAPTPPASEISSYAGLYVSHDPSAQRVRVTGHGDRLELDVVGEFRSPLAPVPNSQLLACEVGDCWVAFLVGDKGTVDRVEVHHLGRQIVAVRTQSGMVF